MVVEEDRVVGGKAELIDGWVFAGLGRARRVVEWGRDGVVVVVGTVDGNGLFRGEK